MILYGRYFSPYVRRVALWLGLQERAFEQRPLKPNIGEDADIAKLQTVNSLGRVPALTLDDGVTLVETSSIIDYLEETAPSWGKRLLPRKGQERRLALMEIGYATGVADKAVALRYEMARPAHLVWPDWKAHLITQMTGGLDWLEAHVPESGYFGRSRPKGVDAAVVTAYDFVEFFHPDTLNHPKLQTLSKRTNRRALFANTHPRKVPV